MVVASGETKKLMQMEAEPRQQMHLEIAGGYPQILEVDVLKKYITQVDVGICRATPREGEQIVGGSRRIMKNPHKGFLGGCMGMYLVQTSSDV